MTATKTATIAPYRWVPNGYEVLISDSLSGAIVYTSPNFPTSGTVLAVTAIAYSGKRGKKDWYIRFSSLTKRDEYVARYLKGLSENIERKANLRASAKGFEHGYVVGDVLVNSWGWEQTTNDAYQIISKTPSTITLRQIKTRTVEGSYTCNGMAAKVTPIPGDFVDAAKPFIKRPVYAESYGKGYVNFEFGGSRLHEDGHTYYESWYA